MITLTTSIEKDGYTLKMTQDWNEERGRGEYRFYIEKDGHLLAVHTSFGELDGQINSEFLEAMLQEFLEA